MLDGGGESGAEGGGTEGGAGCGPIMGPLTAAAAVGMAAVASSVHEPFVRPRAGARSAKRVFGSGMDREGSVASPHV